MSIQVRNLTHVYGEGTPQEHKAIENINFDLYDGEIAAIIGHTGSGKTTLVQHLNGLLKPKAGSIIIGGVDITKPDVSMIDIRKRVGLVFQYPEYQLFEETVAKDVAFGPKNLGLTEKEIEYRVEEALELVGLDYSGIKDRSPFELSGGQKRRVAIAGVVAMKPQILILDEPTAGLDPEAHRDIMDMIRNVHRKENNITIFITHDMDDVAANADRVLVMNSGKLVTVGTPKDVFTRKSRVKDVGLDIPTVTKLMRDLRGLGENVSTDIITVQDAEKELVRLIRKKVSAG